MKIIKIISMIFAGMIITSCSMDITNQPTDKNNNCRLVKFNKSVSSKIFNVKSFGAKGNGKSDDTSAIIAAIFAADSSTSSTEIAEVYFPTGIYRVSSSNEFAIQLKNISGVFLRGEGTNSILLVSNPANGCFGFSYCTNIFVEGLTVDYDPLPFTQGTIVAVNLKNKTYDLKIDDDYLELSHPAFTNAESRWGITVDLKRKAYGLYAYFSSSWTNVGKRTWRMTSDNPDQFEAQPLKVGERFAHMARRWTAFDFGYNYCVGVSIKNVNIYAASGLTVGVIYCDKIVVDNLIVKIKPESSRLLSTNGDCVHSASCSGGLLIENCFFEGMPDDGINIHGRGGTIVSNITDKIKIVGTPRAALFEPGNKVQIGDIKKGGARQAVIVEAIKSNDISWIITLDRPMPNLNAGWSGGDKFSNISRCGQGAVIRNNKFGTHRGRDILLRSRNIIVSNNYFCNPSLGWDNVCLANEYWYFTEGPATRNVKIIDNIFVGGKNKWSWSGAAIDIYSHVMPGVQSPFYDSRNILIESNNFINLDGPAVKATSVSNVKIIDNKVKNEEGIKLAESPIILLENANEILIKNLKIYDLNKSTYAAVHIKDSVPENPKAVVISNLSAKLNSHSVKIKDDRKNNEK